MKHSDDGHFAKLLALAEAVPAALEGKTDALAAAWAALGDEDHGS